MWDGTVLKRWVSRHIVFVLTVLAPTLVALSYFGLIASDVYISESRFVVRSQQQQQMSSGGMVGALLQSTGLAHTEDDAYPVQNFLVSRDALKELDEKLDLRKHYSNHSVDIFSRFPGLDWNASFENFHRYYRRRVAVDYDPVSSISVLTVRAYTAAEAQGISELLLEMGERLVNSLNERSRTDLIRFAEQDVAVAAGEARQAATALFEYRRTHGVYEPNKQAEIELTSIEKLQEELIETQAQVVQLTKLAPGNPQISALRGRIDALRDAIAREAAKVTTANGSLSAHAAKMDRLLVDLDFADKLLATALTALETARSQARRQEIYLERLVEPNLPDYAMEPYRVRSILTVLAVGLILWGVVSLVLASVREHTD
jgi:capsular polysaccharide transport system permease protein